MLLPLVICFDLFVPPVLQRERFNRDAGKDTKFRQRIDCINPSHGIVAPYAHQVRLVMHSDKDITEFTELCRHAELQRPIRANIEADAMGFFARKQLYKLSVWLRECEWPIAFQLEGLLRNGLLITPVLMEDLRPRIEQMIREQPEVAASILAAFAGGLRNQEQQRRPIDMLQEAIEKSSSPLQIRLPTGNFFCHHVTVTPTRILMEGPYPIQSNRVIRQYARYQNNFIRVDFRDEDRLQYRWERDVCSGKRDLMVFLFGLIPIISRLTVKCS